MMHDLNGDVLQYLKMKRIKHEQIQTSVSHYLRRRQYPDSELAVKKDSRFTQNMEELTLRGHSEDDSNMENVLSYSSISGDATACDQQFARLKQFILDAVEPYRDELQSLIYPMFVHVYLEMLCNGHKTPAHKFYGRHIGQLKEEAEHRDILDTLMKLSCRDEVLASRSVTEFRDHKYVLGLSKEAFNYLTRYLKAEDNMIILQIFNKHVKVEVKVDHSLFLELKGDKPAQEAATPSANSTSEKKPVSDQVTKEMLMECIQRLQALPPCLPSICFLAVTNAHQGLSCTNVSYDRRFVVGGFEDSSLRLWSLGSSLLLRGPSLATTPSQISLAADFILNTDHFAKQFGEWSLRDDQSVVMRGHSGTVNNAHFLPSVNPSYLLSCSKDTTVRLWSLETYTNVVSYRGHNYPVWDIDVGSQNSFFVSGSADRTAKLWCTDRIYPLRSFVGHTLDVSRVMFHPNGTYIATGSGDRSVRLWSIKDGKCMRLMQGHRGTILSLAFSPNGHFLASSGEDRRIRIWDLSSGMLFKELRGHMDTVYALTFSRDGSMLASGGLDACIRIWDVRKEADFSSAQPENNTSPEQLTAYPTKSTPIHHLQFTNHNLLLGSGPLL